MTTAAISAYTPIRLCSGSGSGVRAAGSGPEGGTGTGGAAGGVIGRIGSTGVGGIAGLSIT